MKFAFAVFVLVSLSAVSSQFVANWTLDWQTQNATCAPSYFIISGTSATGYSISYTYPFSVSCPSSFTSTLTAIGGSGTFFNDTKGQNITYNAINNTVLLVYSINYPNPILFSQNGAYIPQEEVIGLVAGVWTNLQYNQAACTIAPPYNISIGAKQKYGGVNSPNATYYYTSSSLSSTTVGTVLAVPQIDQPIWKIYYSPSATYANISYSVDQATNQSTLQFQVSSSLGSCIGTYTRPSNLYSGTWYPDWQDWEIGNVTSYIGSNTIPVSVQVITILNMYMRVVYNFNTSTAVTAVLYSTTNGYTDSYYGSIFYPVSNTFMMNSQSLGSFFLYSTSGSVLSIQSFLGKWTNPVPISDPYADLTDFADYCCLPQSVTIANYTGPTLSTLLHYDTDALTYTVGCESIGNVVASNSNYLKLQVTIPSPNGTMLLYSVTNSQYNLKSWLFLNNTQLEIIYNLNSQGNCTFSMSSNVPPPSPLSAQWIAKGVSVFVFALIVIFI